MDQFPELTTVIVRTLQRSQRALSLAALVDEVNQIPNGRALPASTIRLLLMKRSDLFTEISSGQWALASWSPTDQGVVRVDISGGQNPWKPTMGQVEAPRPLRRSLEELATEVLGHLVPASIDRPNLDTLTIFHISQSTYKPDSLPRATSDTNILVPPSLYEVTRNYAWRYPPMLETTFFLRASPAQHPCLHLRLVFGTATLLEYHEWRRFGDTQRVQRRNVATGEVRVPADFATVDLAGSCFSIREDVQAKQFCRKAAMPRFYEVEIKHTVKGDARYEYNIPAIDPVDNVFVKAYDEKSRQTWTSPNVDLFKPAGLNSQLPSDDPRLALVVLRVGGANARVDVETEYLDDWGVYKVTIRFSNTSAGLSTHPQDHAILLNSIIFPHIYIRAEYASCILSPQQHVDRLQEIEDGHPFLSPEDGFIASLTTQTNCVLANSTSTAGTLVVTPFGVYDTMRVNPIQGPAFASLCANIDTFLSGSTLSETARRYIQGSAYRSSSVLAVMRAAQRAFGIQNLRSYQWKAIQNRLELLATSSPNVTTIIRAPTAAGKTLVFMVNAAIHYLLTGHRAVMTFPTRILNEDMFKRLTRFVYALRDEIAKVDSDLVERISGGIVIGTSDPSYQAIVNPVVGQMMVQYESCPRCQEAGRRSKVICRQVGGRLLGVCQDESCKHEISYMFGPREAQDVLPALTIATPDKLFYEATISSPQKALRFFGAPCIRCICGYHITLLNKAGQIEDTVTCPNCNRVIDKEQAFKARAKALPKRVVSPPLYFVLDEVHSLYGITATLVGYFFSLLRQMARSFGSESFEPVFETGTATIANERDLLGAVTHQELIAFPEDREFFEYFQVQADRVRYRTLMFMPVGKANRSTITNSIIGAYQASRPGGPLATALSERTRGAYDFILAYIPKKANGYIIANEMRRVLDDKSITFLSGDAPSAMLVKILQQIADQDVDLLLANMVVSLGIDLPRLNNMLLLGVPPSMTEMVQTVGRTGRLEQPGHVVIHLQPSIPRDEFVYRNFHAVMGDVSGYYDRKPVAPVNTYVADLILLNVAHALLSTRLIEDYRNCFADNAGKWLMTNGNAKAFLGRLVKEILGRDGTNDIQREVVRVIQPRLRELIIELSNKRGFLSDWARNHPEMLYSLRARSERVPVVISQLALLEQMKKGNAPTMRPVEEEFAMTVGDA